MFALCSPPTKREPRKTRRPWQQRQEHWKRRRIAMQRARIRNGELEYESHGTGEPVVFIHGAMAVAFSPLFGETSLRNYRCVTYNRRGFGGSTRSARVSVREHAQDCHELMRFLGIERAHVVGHSVGVLMALQLALDHPEQVHSLSLLETVLPS
ncbi:MAG: alpha/beta hydrolase, partial [SAR202 cluster bacterium]|nr:alpha/beta hydrolase [SAR202 cluster bacterium]